MLEVREVVEKEIVWKIGRGEVNVWWDNWLGEGAVAVRLGLQGKGQSKELLREYVRENRFDLDKMGIHVKELEGLDGEYIMQGEGRKDVVEWKPSGKGQFSVVSTKDLFRKKRMEGSELERKWWCFCCSEPKFCSLQHLFCIEEVAAQVWDYFAKSMGLRVKRDGVMQTCYDWWKGVPQGCCGIIVNKEEFSLTSLSTLDGV
nr:uncharacterized protein LOC109173561 [Ipomoea trifida]